MELCGTLSDNLLAAVTSARRLRGKPVHQDSLNFWHELLALARARLGKGMVGEGQIKSFITKLETELSERASHTN